MKYKNKLTEKLKIKNWKVNWIVTRHYNITFFGFLVLSVLSNSNNGNKQESDNELPCLF